jgi:hypothetical protein
LGNVVHFGVPAFPPRHLLPSLASVGMAAHVLFDPGNVRHTLRASRMEDSEGVENTQGIWGNHVD